MEYYVQFRCENCTIPVKLTLKKYREREDNFCKKCSKKNFLQNALKEAEKEQKVPLQENLLQDLEKK